MKKLNKVVPTVVTSIREAWNDRTKNTLKLCELCYAVQAGKLYNLMGYAHQDKFVKKELPFCQNTFLTFAGVGGYLQRHRYTSKQKLAIVKLAQPWLLYKIMCRYNTKLTVQAIQRLVVEFRTPGTQGDGKLAEVKLNVNLQTAFYDRAIKELKTFGLQIDPKTGRKNHLSQAFMKMMDHHGIGL